MGSGCNYSENRWDDISHFHNVVCWGSPLVVAPCMRACVRALEVNLGMSGQTMRFMSDLGAFRACSQYAMGRTEPTSLFRHHGISAEADYASWSQFFCVKFHSIFACLAVAHACNEVKPLGCSSPLGGAGFMSLSMLHTAGRREYDDRASRASEPELRPAVPDVMGRIKQTYTSQKPRGFAFSPPLAKGAAYQVSFQRIDGQPMMVRQQIKLHPWEVDFKIPPKENSDSLSMV